MDRTQKTIAGIMTGMVILFLGSACPGIVADFSWPCILLGSVIAGSYAGQSTLYTKTARKERLHSMLGSVVVGVFFLLSTLLCAAVVYWSSPSVWWEIGPYLYYGIGFSLIFLVQAAWVFLGVVQEIRRT